MGYKDVGADAKKLTCSACLRARRSCPFKESLRQQASCLNGSSWGCHSIVRTVKCKSEVLRRDQTRKFKKITPKKREDRLYGEPRREASSMAAQGLGKKFFFLKKKEIPMIN